MKRPLPVGSLIEVSDQGGKKITATIETYRQVGGSQIISAVDEQGRYHTLALDLRSADGGESEVVDISYARHLALQVMGEHHHRIPVSTESNVLADAVIALTGGYL